ncbi:DNA-directed RNA polymerase, partial [Scytalidium lignicola]
MDTHALLKSQGWRGTGHSLHPTNDSTGLTRPILVSRKQNNLGVGKKQHRTSDMWWMNAFDKSLKGLDTSKDGIVVQTISNGGLDMVVKGGSNFVGNGGLYTSFVKGESLGGTITPEETGKKLLNEEQKRRNKSSRGTKEERRAKKAARRAEKAKKETENSVSISTTDERNAHWEKETESKEERKERKRREKLLREQQASNKEVSQDPSAGKVEENVDMGKKLQSKEERKERKRRKKLLLSEDENGS